MDANTKASVQATRTMRLPLVYAVIVLLSFLFAAGGKIAGANNSVTKKNYLRSVIPLSIGLERDFLTALEKQENVDPLLESLGLLQVEKKTPFGSAQEPGKTPLPLQIDAGETTAINFRKTLVWHEAFDESHQALQLLIFDQTNKKWPGSQPITIILLDDKLRVLAWLESGGVPMFKKAALETDGKLHILKVVSENRNSTIETEQFEIKAQSIKEVTQRSGASRASAQSSDSDLTTAETEVLMRATALICREKGDTNQPSAQWLAFQKYLKLGPAAKPQILELIKKGSPACRLYAVILLKQIEPESADQVLHKMKGDGTPVNYIIGCGVNSTTVDVLASRILKGEELVQLKQ